MVSGVSFLYLWSLAGAFVEKNTFKVFNISLGVVCSLP